MANKTLSKKTMIRRMILLLAFILIIGSLPLMNNEAYASSYRKVENSEFSKLTQGGLTKKQVESVLTGLIDHYNKDIVKNKLTRKKINELGFDPIMNQRALNINDKYISTYAGDDYYITAYPLDKVNKCMSFYTDNRYDEYYYSVDENGNYIWETDDAKWYYYYVYGGFNSFSKIYSAKVNDEQMVLTFAYGGDFVGFSPEEYTAVLKVQENGRYRLDSISAKRNVYTAYNNLLSNDYLLWHSSVDTDEYDKYVKTDSFKFALAYIDNDSTPELIIYDKEGIHADGYMQIYTYRNGKVKFLYNAGDVFKYYKKKGLFITGWSGMGMVNTYHHKLVKGKVKNNLLTKSVEYITAKKTKTRYMNSAGKSISQKTYNKKLKSLVGKKKASKVKFYNNTEKNRKKLIKG